MLENAIKTIINKPESFEAQEDLKWLHGIETVDGALEADYIADMLGGDVVDILRKKFPLNYKGAGKLGYLCRSRAG